MFGGFGKRPRARSEPEAEWVVVLEEGSIRVVDPAGDSLAVGKSELTGVVIETNDSGPWGADVWWLLFGAGGAMACAFPLGATGETAAVDYLVGLAGFDHEEMIKAMTSTDNNAFVLWTR